MEFKNLVSQASKQANSIFNKNDRIATNIVKPIPTSKFDLSFTNTTTFNSGLLVPIFFKECIPGDFWDIDVSTLIRQSAISAPVMDNAIFDISFFFVPYRLIQKDFKYLMGENKNAGIQSGVQKLQALTFDIAFKYSVGDLANYLGIPSDVDMSKTGLKINTLPFKAYGKIWNDFFRDQNVQGEIDIENNGHPLDDLKISEYNSLGQKTFYNIIQYGKGLAPTSRLSDYFSTCLPYTQKGPAVEISSLALNNLVIGSIPIENGSLYSEFAFNPYASTMTPGDPVAGNYKLVGNKDDGGVGFGPSSPYISPLYMSLKTKEGSGYISAPNGEPYTVNDLRMSVALQHFYEKNARGGTRYSEILFNHFGISINDSEIDRAEYIGGFRNNVVINNVVQSSASTATSPIGSVGAVSITGAKVPKIEYAVEQFGLIMGCITIRSNVSYGQGLDRFWLKEDYLDFYWPSFANIGEQPVYKYELFLSETGSDDNLETFGYNEPFAYLRYSQNMLSGFLSPNNANSLIDLYSFTEKYKNAPTLNGDWMEYDKDIIGNTMILDADENVEFFHQYMANFYFNVYVDRQLPLYGIPGIDKI